MLDSLKTMFGLLHTFYIKPTERGVLFNRSDFQRILLPGLYRYFGPHWNVTKIDIRSPRVTLDNLEFLLQQHTAAFAQHCEIVRTSATQAALVETPVMWCTVSPNQLSAFWRGWQDTIVHRFDLEASIEIPAELVAKIIRVNGLTNCKIVRVPENQAGLLFQKGDFLRLLEPGTYGFWDFDRDLRVDFSSRLTCRMDFAQPERLIDAHPEFVEAYGELVDVPQGQVAIVRERGNPIAIVHPGQRQLFWSGVTVETIDLEAEPKLTPRLVSELILGEFGEECVTAPYLEIAEVRAQHVGLLYEKGQFVETLDPGWHVWWTFARSLKTETIDLRLQMMEVGGQEILTKDKVALRLNLTAGFRIVDPVRAKTALVNFEQFLYKELQFALRSAVGTKLLDELLEDKGAIDRDISEHIQPKASEYGIEIVSVGVKDIILPGEMKTILSQVVEAEKSAQANVIRRREETAATRSMLNTARVMESNPTALRLKELEILERIAEKIDRINVNGGLENVLTDLIRFEGRDLPPAGGSGDR